MGTHLGRADLHCARQRISAPHGAKSGGNFSAGRQRFAEDRRRARYSRSPQSQRRRTYGCRLRPVSGQRGILRARIMTIEPRVAAATLLSTNPATGEILGELACATTEDVERAVLAAKTSQPQWQATTVGERIAVLRRFQHLLTQRKLDVARLICREAGKPTA